MRDVEARDHVRNFQPPVTGDEIITYFNLAPGRIIGELKDCIKDAILDGVIENNREQAWQLLLQLARERGIEKTEVKM
jgi:hypothetical protein